MQTVLSYSRDSFLKRSASCWLISYFGPRVHSGRKHAVRKQCLHQLHFPTGMSGRDALQFIQFIIQALCQEPGLQNARSTSNRGMRIYHHTFSSCNNPQCQKELGKNYLPRAYYQSCYCHSQLRSEGPTLHKSSWDGDLHGKPMKAFSALSSTDVLSSRPYKLHLYFRNNERTMFRHNWLVTQDSTVFATPEIFMSCSVEEQKRIKQLRNKGQGSSHS